MTDSPAEIFYKKIGYTQLGSHIPNYGYWPDGTLGGGTFFWKDLRREALLTEKK